MLTTIIPSYSEMEDQITERVTAKVTAKVTNEVTAKVTNEMTAKFQDKLQTEAEKWALELKKKDSENNRLRTLLKAHGINENEVFTSES